MTQDQKSRPIYSYVRAEEVANGAKIAADTRHAARDDGSARRRRRPDADPACLALGWRAGICPELGRRLGDDEWLRIPAPPPTPPKPADDRKRRKRPPRPVPWVADIRAAVAERMDATSARLHWRADQPRALGLGVGISREWIAEGGAVHDPENARNRAHRQMAMAWLRDAFGDGLITARADYDEFGVGWVDAYVVPVLDMAAGGRPRRNSLHGNPAHPDAPEFLAATPPIPTVAVTAALAAINERYGYAPRAKPFVGLQDDWHAWAVQLDFPHTARGR